MLYNQKVWFIMSDSDGRPVKMIGNVILYDAKTGIYRIRLLDNMIVHVEGSLLHPYGDAVPLMNGSSTAPGPPVTMPRTASSTSFNFTLNNEEGKENSDVNSNIDFEDEKNGDPWARMVAFLNARNGAARNRTVKNTSSKNESGKGIPIPKSKKRRNTRHGGRRRRRTVRRGH